MERKRVVITGIGMVTPVGLNREETWKNVCNGIGGAAPLKAFDASTWPTQFACEVKDFVLPENAILAKDEAFLCRPTGFGAAAALEAMTDSGLEGNIDPFDLGVCVGASAGAIKPEELVAALVDSEVSAGNELLKEKSSNDQPMVRNHPGTLASILSSRWKAYGPVTTMHTACASSGQSSGHAFLQIQRGDSLAVIAGGADSLAAEILLAGFCLLGTLSTRNSDPQKASRPFDKDRDGFVASEGAAFFVMEEREHALARGAKIYCEVGGYGETESAYRITDLPPQGRGIVEAMHDALKQSGLEYEQIDYINAHGTATELNDRIEALAIRKVFGARGCKPYVSSTKSETGHMISAAGALEAAFCALAIRDKTIPPTANLENTDCGDDIAFVAKEKLETSVKATMSNSIGFGGTNTALVLMEAQ